MWKNRIVAAVAVMGLVVASTALAGGSKKVLQTGKVDGESQASAELVVIKQGGAPKSVRNVKLKDLLSNCTNGEARITLRLSGAAKVNDSSKFKKTYADGSSKIKLEGKVKRDSSRVHASISGTTIKITGAGRCDVPNVEFTTKR